MRIGDLIMIGECLYIVVQKYYIHTGIALNSAGQVGYVGKMI